MKIKSIKKNETVVSPSQWNLVEFSAQKDKRLKKQTWKDVWQDQNIIVTNMQWLLLHGAELPYIDMLTVDEVHNIKAKNEISALAKNMKVDYKFGCTGTLPREQEDKWMIEGIFGPVREELKISTLQDKQILTNIRLMPVCFHHAKKENFRKTSNGDPDDVFKAAQEEFQKEAEYLSTFAETNRKIVGVAEGMLAKCPDWNIMILFDYIAQGEQLYSLCRSDRKYYIDGSIENTIRQDIIDKMDNSGGNILIGNCKCVGTGLTVKKVNAVFLCIIGSSQTKTIQAVGRGMQRKADKSTLVVVDFYHNYKYSTRHFQERCDRYREYYNIEAGRDYSVKDVMLP